MSFSRDQVDAVDQLGDDLARQLARLLDRDALGQRVAADRAMAALDDILHRRIKLGLDADHLDPRLHRLGGRRDAAEISPPPPIGITSVSSSGASSSISSATRPRPGHHRHIVERMDEDVALLRFELPGMGIGVVEPLAVQHDMGAMALGLGDFDHRRRHRHDDRHRNAEPPAMIGDRLGMVAGRGRDHAALPLRLVSCSNLLSAPRSL